MYKKKELLDLIFFDAETLPVYKSFDELPEGLKKIWLEKYHFKALEKEVESRKKKFLIENILNGSTPSDSVIKTPTTNEVYIKEAGLYPEFSKVYCISFGLFTSDYKEEISTSCYDDEKETIGEFLELLDKLSLFNLAGYNINDFDIPFILKRMWINRMLDNYPPQLQLKDSKPWTVKHVDHMLTYKAGSWTNVSLGLLCEVFGIPTPKDEFGNDEFTTLMITGKITKEDAIRYCEKDVSALMKLMLEVSSEKSNYDGKSKVSSYIGGKGSVKVVR